MSTMTKGEPGIWNQHDPEPKPPKFPPNYPDGTPRLYKLAEDPTIEYPIVLSEALNIDALLPDYPYVLQDSSSRVLCVAGAATSSWQWAYMGAFASYPDDVFPIRFETSPSSGPAAVYITDKSGKKWYLYSNGTATSWEYVYWSPNAQSASHPQIKLSAVDSGGGKFKLTWKNGNTTMSLRSDGGAWNWLFSGGKDYVGSEFSAHRFYVTEEKIRRLYSAVWPNVTFSNNILAADDFYQCIDDTTAQKIYRDSQLSKYKYKPDVFDCDDFAYVYKGQACKAAYDDNVEYSYCVSFVAATTSKVGHAANLFVDYTAKVKLLEPQNGSIVDAAKWNNGGDKYSPMYVIL